MAIVPVHRSGNLQIFSHNTPCKCPRILRNLRNSAALAAGIVRSNAIKPSHVQRVDAQMWNASFPIVRSSQEEGKVARRLGMRRSHSDCSAWRASLESLVVKTLPVQPLSGGTILPSIEAASHRQGNLKERQNSSSQSPRSQDFEPISQSDGTRYLGNDFWSSMSSEVCCLFYLVFRTVLTRIRRWTV